MVGPEATFSVLVNSVPSVFCQGCDVVANGVGGAIIGLLGVVSLFADDGVTFGRAVFVFATHAISPAERAKESDTVQEAGDWTAHADLIPPPRLIAEPPMTKGRS